MGGDGDRANSAAATMAPSELPAASAATTAASKRMASLGWLTESALMPKKQRAIEGVGAASIVELKAQLYRTQEQTRKEKAGLDSSQEFHRAKGKVQPHDRFSVKNSGVDSRARKDKLELKAENDGSKVYAALEKKAELYEKLARGELPDEEEKEKYCVDFFQKSLAEDKCEQLPERQDLKDARELEDGENDDDNSLLNSKPFGPGRTSEFVDRDEHKQFVREVHEEANRARHQVTTAKLRRQEQGVARREKLRQAYLRKQLEKLTSAAKAAETADSSAGAAASGASGI